MGNKLYFDDINNLSKRDLGTLTTELMVSFSRFLRHTECRISTGSYGPFEFTPEKPNTARIVTSFYFDYEPENIQEELYESIEGELDFIVFLPNDGTGDNKTFQHGDLIVPENLRFAHKQERVYPRKKRCESEVFFPLFSMGRDYIQRSFVSLDVLTTNAKTQPPTIVRGFSLGVNPEAFAAAEGRAIELEPYFQFTVDGENSDRFGDPHSVFYDGKLSSDRIQVVGFLELSRRSQAYRFFKERVSQTPQL